MVFLSLLFNTGSTGGDLLESMPSGHDIYITFNPDTAGMFDPRAQSLTSYEGFEMLCGGTGGSGDNVGRIFIRFSDIIEDDLVHCMLLESSIDGSEVITELSMISDNRDFSRYTSLISSVCGETEFHIQEGADGTLRLNIDMGFLDTFLTEEGIDRDLSMGIQEFGFSSFSDFLALFAGEILITFSDNGEEYAGSLQISLEDTVAVEGLLAVITEELNEPYGDWITAFDFDGITCYRSMTPVAPGISSIEYGIVNGNLIITGGIGLADISEGIPYEEFVQAQGFGISSGPGVVLTADLDLIQLFLSTGGDALRKSDFLFPELNGAAVSILVENGLYRTIRIRMILNASNDDPESLLTGILGLFGLVILFGTSCFQ